jgi:hypothetical protein
MAGIAETLNEAVPKRRRVGNVGGALLPSAGFTLLLPHGGRSVQRR